MDLPIKELEEMFEMITKKLPEFISALTKTLFSKESGENIGKAVGAMYKELVASGMDKKDAFELSRDYLKTIQDLSKQGINNNTVNM